MKCLGKVIYQCISILVLCVCLFSGCGIADASADQAENAAPGYQEFCSLYGMGVEEVQNATGKELTFVEEFYDTGIYNDADGTEYRFLTQADALYGIGYRNLDAGTALELAQICYDEIFEQYGDDKVFPIQNHIYEIGSVEELENSKTVQQYNEMWHVSYNDRMEKKVEGLKGTDRVNLSLDLLTPLFMDQGTYTVQLYQLSAGADQADVGSDLLY